ncbi:MAG: Cytochrome c family protein [Hydrocarboniphaga sp.]|uniref:c-type cytochrome n=1 Tax=Hydrocarboniphaga sp. TaxID=2033016 RepID=UPI0026142304|nr:nuclear transport factor 2 family protein [Hydrocarboniphaga sp.]MDB5972161.1 Cytochrome c family protein [Hydrocarboniphaga sp.]
MKILKIAAALAVAGLLAALGMVYSGAYPIGADVPHTRAVFWALETLRERSIAQRTQDIEVPNLDSSDLLLAGGPDYNEMCAGCHLKPGKTSSEISKGLYPAPPNLAIAPSEDGDAKASAARQFWIIKHGIKASGMAAWGPTHDDARIWAMVAFLQKLPTLTPAQYQILTARSGSEMDHDDMDEDAAPASDAHDGHDEHAPMDMPGMAHAAETPGARSAQDAVNAFTTALKTGDAAGAALWLAPDVVIYEGGEVERSRSEYQAHHLAADIAFMKTSEIQILKRDGGESGDTAWVNTETRVRGKSSKGRDIDLLSTETALLRRTAQGWRIVHLHWSSSDYPPGS